MKEPGQLFYEALFGEFQPWNQQPNSIKSGYAEAEAAIRDDERARTVEECARTAKRYDHDRCVFDSNGKVIPSCHGGKIAAAIRALKKPGAQETAAKD